MSLICFATASALAASTEDPSGVWVNHNSALHITIQGSVLRAKVIALANPTYTADEETHRPVGSPRRDDNNPDEALRDREILGLDLLKGFAFKDGKWRGELYDPESGNWYSAQLTVARNGQLKLRGYVGMPMFGRTAEFAPAEACGQDAAALADQTPLIEC